MAIPLTPAGLVLLELLILDLAVVVGRLREQRPMVLLAQVGLAELLLPVVVMAARVAPTTAAARPLPVLLRAAAAEAVLLRVPGLMVPQDSSD